MLKFVDAGLHFVQDENYFINSLLQVGSGSVGHKINGSGGPKSTDLIGSVNGSNRIRILIPVIISNHYSEVKWGRFSFYTCFISFLILGAPASLLQGCDQVPNRDDEARLHRRVRSCWRSQGWQDRGQPYRKTQQVRCHFSKVVSQGCVLCIDNLPTGPLPPLDYFFCSLHGCGRRIERVM